MADLARLRQNYRRSLPLLQAEGWSKEEIEAINPAIREALKAVDEGLLGCSADWLEGKAERAAREIRPVENAVRLEDMVITTQAEREQRVRARRWA